MLFIVATSFVDCGLPKRQPTGTLTACANCNLLIFSVFLVDGGWSTWSTWGQCKDGKVQRKRGCNNPAPLLGAPCQGEDQQEESCGKSQIFIRSITD